MDIPLVKEANGGSRMYIGGYPNYTLRVKF